uniref:Uncharacterized protein n=1 Tax=Eptatretus burgeri TaxID=7764 RepID=A0A8C4N5F2_EPTBU
MKIQPLNFGEVLPRTLDTCDATIMAPPFSQQSAVHFLRRDDVSERQILIVWKNQHFSMAPKNGGSFLSKLIVTVILAYIMVPSQAKRTNMDDGGFLLQTLLNKYSINGSLTVSELKALLETKVGFDGDQKGAFDLWTNSSRSQCLSIPELLSAHGFGRETNLTKQHFVQLCPTVMQQFKSASCFQDFAGNAGDVVKPHASEVWCYGMLSVTLINLFSLLGIVIAPLRQKPYFPQVLVFFLSLAMGTLTSTAMLQLIPEAFGLNPKEHGYIYKSAMIFGGFYLFFFVEKILKMVLTQKDEVSHFSLITFIDYFIKFPLLIKYMMVS